MCSPAARSDGSDDFDDAAGVGTREAGPIGAEVGGGDLKIKARRQLAEREERLRISSKSPQPAVWWRHS